MTIHTTAPGRSTAVDPPGQLRLGAAVMAVAALGFVGYAVIFFGRSFTGAFLELGIGPDKVDVTREQIHRFSMDLHH